MKTSLRQVVATVTDFLLLAIFLDMNEIMSFATISLHFHDLWNVLDKKVILSQRITTSFISTQMTKFFHTTIPPDLNATVYKDFSEFFHTSGVTCILSGSFLLSLLTDSHFHYKQDIDIFLSRDDIYSEGALLPAFQFLIQFARRMVSYGLLPRAYIYKQNTFGRAATTMQILRTDGHDYEDNWIRLFSRVRSQWIAITFR